MQIRKVVECDQCGLAGSEDEIMVCGDWLGTPEVGYACPDLLCRECRTGEYAEQEFDWGKQGNRLYLEVSILLGSECVCGGDFLECHEDCCPSDPDSLEYMGMCGKQTMTELKQVLDSWDISQDDPAIERRD